MTRDSRPQLLLLSRVLPFPGVAGQQQRVLHKLLAFKERFHVTFFGLLTPEARKHRADLADLCDEVVLLPERYAAPLPRKLLYRALGALYCWRTGLKFSNYLVDRVELSPARIRPWLSAKAVDAVVYEYWHAYRTVDLFRSAGALAVLDMHDILWRSLDRQLRSAAWPRLLRERRVRAYRKREERAWHRFDAVIAINAAERDEVTRLLGSDTPVLYAPMGKDLTDWPYCWRPALPPRVAYFGALGNPARVTDALHCYRRVLPRIWERAPQTEFWLIGSNPPSTLQDLAGRDPRVVVTGTLERVQDTLAEVSVLLCPWSGTFGFRSRLVEAMALGVPVVASPDAAWGMELEHGHGIFLHDSEKEMAAATVRLLSEPELAREQSTLARAAIEALYSFDATYGALAHDLELLLLQGSASDRRRTTRSGATSD